MTRRVPYYFMTFWGIFSTRGEKYDFCVDGSMHNDFEPTRGEIEHRSEHRNEYPNWLGGGGTWTRWRAVEWGQSGGVGPEWGWGPEWGGGMGRAGGWGPYLVFHLSYLVSNLCYLGFHPLSGIPSPLSAVPSPLSGIPSPYLAPNPPLWYPIPDSRYPYITKSPKWNSSLLDIIFIAEP